MSDLSTLEYLYDLRCCRASSETHSCAAVSVRAIEVSVCILQTRDREGP
jgi:polyferredoxin